MRSGEKRRPGRPPTYVFDRPEGELTENERRLKASVMKRRQRQNRSYHRRKRAKELMAESKRLGVLGSPGTGFGEESCLFVVPGSDPGGVSPDSSAYSPPCQEVPQGLPKGGEVEELGPASSNNAIEAMLGNVPDQVSYVSEAHDPPSSFGCGAASLSRVISDGSGCSAAGASPVASKVTSLAEGADDETLLIDEILDVTTHTSMQHSAHLVRCASARAGLVSSTEGRLRSLHAQARDGLRDLVVFPGSFDGEAAAAVMGLPSDCASAQDVMAVLRPLVDLNFVTVSANGRYAMNKVAAALLKEKLRPDRVCTARKRFVEHFLKVLRGLDTDGVVRNGKERARAMQTFNLERGNMKYVHQLCRQMGVKQLRSFLTTGAAVLRFCVKAQERVGYFEEVVDHGQALTEKSRPQTCAEVREWTRLSLALSEAYYDMLSSGQAESHLSKTLLLMGETVQGKCLPDVVCSVLVLLLLAQLRIERHQPGEAKELIVRSLRAIGSSGLQNTTLAVNAMTSLSVVYLMTKEHDKALKTGTKLIDLVVSLGFKHMPIFADALGTMGLIHLHSGNAAEAEKNFFAGLEVIGSWVGKPWEESVPLQDCQDLDIWLLEGLAKSYSMQRKNGLAHDLLKKASAQRAVRGLGSVGTSWGDNSLSHLPTHIIYPRHVY